MAYLYLLFSSFCSLILVHLLKVTEVKQLRTVNTLTINYLVASITAFVLGWRGTTALSGDGQVKLILLLFCIVAGALFIGNYFVYSKSVHANGVGVSIAAMRLSLLVPVLVSIYWYGELLSPLNVTGVVLTFGALLLLIPRTKRVRFGQVDAGWLLIIVFLLSGLADASLKVYEEEFSIQLNELLFMGFVLTGAFCIGLITCLFQSSGEPLFTRKEWVLGASIGIPNLYSAVFLIYALDGIGGAIAFPLVNILNVLGGTALGLFRWKDQISGWQWSGIAIAVAAIILLLM